MSELLARWVRPSGSEIVMVLGERGWYSKIMSENLHNSAAEDMKASLDV